jgi:hypothetical protein
VPPLTDFLIDLGNDPQLLKQYTRNRDNLLRRKELDRNDAFKDGATVGDMRQAVVAEGGDPGSIANWILVAKVPND